MRRRDFITLLGGTAITWPLAVRAQQPGPMRRIGVLMNVARMIDRVSGVLRLFWGTLQALGWSDGRNVQIDIRWGVNNLDRQRKYAMELAARPAPA